MDSIERKIHKLDKTLVAHLGVWVEATFPSSKNSVNSFSKTSELASRLRVRLLYVKNPLVLESFLKQSVSRLYLINWCLSSNPIKI